MCFAGQERSFPFGVPITIGKSAGTHGALFRSYCKLYRIPLRRQTGSLDDTAMKIQRLSPGGEIHRSKTGIFKRSLRYAPLTLTTLAAMVPPELGAEVTIQDGGVEPRTLDFDA